MKKPVKKSHKIKRLAPKPSKTAYQPQYLSDNSNEAITYQSQLSQSATWLDTQQDMLDEISQQQKIQAAIIKKQQQEHLAEFLAKRGGFHSGVQGYVDYPTQNKVQKKELK